MGKIPKDIRGREQDREIQITDDDRRFLDALKAREKKDARPDVADWLNEAPQKT